MVKNQNNAMSLIRFFLQGDEHKVVEPSRSGILLVELSDNNTMLGETTIGRLHDSLKLTESINYIRIYSDHGTWYLEISSND